eukprot:1155263-Rhodomonas_salina.1
MWAPACFRTRNLAHHRCPGSSRLIESRTRWTAKQPSRPGLFLSNQIKTLPTPADVAAVLSYAFSSRCAPEQQTRELSKLGTHRTTR